MKQKRNNTTGKLVVWVVWLSALLCLLVITAILLYRGTYRSAPPVEETVAATVAPTEAPAAPEEIPEQTYPVLDLEENPYGPEDFGFRGRYLECSAGPCKIGVDVSAWQEEINWPLVKAAGMEYAIIRLGWRGSSEGAISPDEYAQANYRGAKDAGLEVGGYFFSQAITPEEAVEEAQFVLEMIREWKMDLPVVFDWEQNWDRTAYMDPRTLTDCTLAFCQTIEEAGYEAMIYFNMNQAYFDIYLEELTDYDFWLALYESDMVFPYKVDMWQYSCTGSVPGIKEKVDLNIWFTYE